jgi:uncharacterized protein (TIGR02246 family)
MASALEDIAREVMALERKRCDALVAGDLETLQTLMGDDCIVLHGSGKVEGKEAFLRDVFVRLDIKSIEQVDVRVRTYGDTVVVNYVQRMAAAFRSAPDTLIPGDGANFTAIWSKADGAWRMNTLHGTRLPKV